MSSDVLVPPEMLKHRDTLCPAPVIPPIGSDDTGLPRPGWIYIITSRVSAAEALGHFKLL